MINRLIILFVCGFLLKLVVFSLCIFIAEQDRENSSNILKNIFFVHYFWQNEWRWFSIVKKYIKSPFDVKYKRRSAHYLLTEFIRDYILKNYVESI